jgi:hypothetical protein
MPRSLRIRLAFRFGLIDPERVELARLMQEALLRRDADQELRRRHQHRLADLAVPVAYRKSDALEARDIELR